MKVLFIHAHFDDFEFTGGGIFELWRQKLGSTFKGRVIVCTDGRAGHQFRTREETARVRLQEQKESARVGKYDFQQLVLPNGQLPREACLLVDVPLLAALWKAIRDFQPDYIICPPVVTDPLAGIHVDHIAVAEAVRKVAYMINVPHVFSPEYPTDETKSNLCKVPVILNVTDLYQKESNCYDLAIDVEDAFEVICATSWCHQSQIMEWLPWVSSPISIPAPKDFADWKARWRKQALASNAQAGLKSPRVHELFSVTRWGSVPTIADLQRDLPNLSPTFSRLPQLHERLNH